MVCIVMWGNKLYNVYSVIMQYGCKGKRKVRACNAQCHASYAMCWGQSAVTMLLKVSFKGHLRRVVNGFVCAMQENYRPSSRVWDIGQCIFDIFWNVIWSFWSDLRDAYIDSLCSAVRLRMLSCIVVWASTSQKPLQLRAFSFVQRDITR